MEREARLIRNSMAIREIVLAQAQSADPEQRRRMPSLVRVVPDENGAAGTSGDDAIISHEALLILSDYVRLATMGQPQGPGSTAFRSIGADSFR